MNLKRLMKVKDNGKYKSLKLKKIRDEKMTVSTGIFGVAFKDVSEEDIKSVLEEHKGEKGDIQGIQYVIGDMEIEGDEAYIEMKMATDKDEEFVGALLKEWGLADYIEDTVTDFETSEEEVEGGEDNGDNEEGDGSETDWDELEDVAKEKNKEIGADYHFNGKEKFQYGDHVVIKTKDGDVKGIVFNTDVYGDHKKFDVLYKNQNGEVKLQQYVEEEYLEKVSDSRRVSDGADYPYSRYQIVTYSNDIGYDERYDSNDLAELKRDVKEFIKEEEEVGIVDHYKDEWVYTHSSISDWNDCPYLEKIYPLSRSLANKQQAKLDRLNEKNRYGRNFDW